VRDPGKISLNEQERRNRQRFVPGILGRHLFLGFVFLCRSICLPRFSCLSKSLFSAF
jgi:hypothetical protein